jgi:hypothetical protein
MRLLALVIPQIHPEKRIFCLDIKILQFSFSFSAPVIPYISYSIPTTTCGPHISYYPLSPSTLSLLSHLPRSASSLSTTSDLSSLLYSL